MALCVQLSVVLCFLFTVDSTCNTLIYGVSLSPTPPDTPGSGGVDTAVIIGVVVAVAMVILLLIITVVTVLVCVKYKTTSE